LSNIRRLSKIIWNNEAGGKPLTVGNVLMAQGDGAARKGFLGGAQVTKWGME